LLESVRCDGPGFLISSFGSVEHEGHEGLQEGTRSLSFGYGYQLIAARNDQALTLSPSKGEGRII
jgi:hypothetical protein